MKSLTLALCVIAILGASASTFFYFQVGKTKEELQQQVATNKAQVTELQTKLNESTTQGDVLNKRLAVLDGDLGESKSKNTAAESRSTQLSRDISQLRNQLTAKDDTEQTLNREISQLNRELAQAKLAAASVSPEEIEGYKSTIASLQAKVSDLESTRVKSVVAKANPNSGGSATSAVIAEVVSIGAQNAFVILNAGSVKGVQAGQNFTITRKGAAVASGQVSSVQANYAVAQIAPNSIRGGLIKGDTAALTE